MKRSIVFVTLAIAVFAVTASVALAAVPRLSGSVGPGFTISLKKAGKNVKTLKAGKYTLTVQDKSSIHNFVLEGKGFEKQITTVPFSGTKTVTLALKKGRYKFYCAPHESTMFGFITVK